MPTSQQKINGIIIIIIIAFLLNFTNSYTLYCNGRSKGTQITIKNDAGYVPQFYMTFGILLRQNQTITQNLTIVLKADNECIPNQRTMNFNFSQSQCRPQIKSISCGRLFYLNCTKSYKQTNKRISFTAEGNVSYLNNSISCLDVGQVVVWSKTEEPTDSTNIGLIIGLSIGGVLGLGLAIFGIIKCRKSQKEKLLNEQE